MQTEIYYNSGSSDKLIPLGKLLVEDVKVELGKEWGPSWVGTVVGKQAVVLMRDAA